MKNTSKKVLLVNIFGTLGYFFCILLWSWAVIIYMPLFLQNEYVKDYLLAAPVEQPVESPVAFESSPALLIFAAIITIGVLIMTAVVLLKLPSSIAKTGRAATTKVATSALPIITKGQPLPATKKRIMTARLVLAIKLLILLLPLGITLLGLIVDLPLPFAVVMVMSGSLALISLIWFLLQYSLAWALRVKTESLV